MGTLFGLTGCFGAGGGTSIVAPNAKVPVSLSRAVLDGSGAIVPAERRVVVGSYHHETRAYALVWSLARLHPKTDVSRSINDQVAAAHGDAIVHLAVAVRHCPWNDALFPFGILPVWPGCADVDVTGQIIRVLPETAAESAKPSPLRKDDGPRPELIETGEAGDEWLHSHCVYRGLLTAADAEEALLEAAARDGDVVEPLSSSRTWAPRAPVAERGAHVREAKIFRCPGGRSDG
jgi:hypothetical protein